ncbi:hypothetical protein HFO88_31120 [Rhizobium leguminosarum]|uniref:hypothetical protein n=1 Tax=Rhizobium leguminosarum TaxID=384 RepID=UPI001C97DDD3|nr:hypothetical protein [Rhizobium leguminosarum]MBY5904736.1 hypothetical protein [Rhizobium leguminosarum]MBY5911827.1 hypothetical protein [Rhizobium leguminosarum]MBY5919257.1 hypothetical protein [Rhizobium leguminosarum]
MSHTIDPTPLINDPAREAVDPMRGYSYQILRSVEAWLGLGDGEILVLEGAEDLDQIGPGHAVTEQVKDTAGTGNLTLRSANALSAIGHFWAHKLRNPGVALQFRYLTTSGVGQERGEGLNLSLPGIDAWEAIRRAPTTAASVEHAGRIKAYLATCDVLPQSLRDFLAAASVEAFIADLVQPFAWITGQPDVSELQGRIEARLIELGDRKHIGAAAAAGALAPLYLAAWSNATLHDRPPLRRGDLLRIFEDAGTAKVSGDVLVDLIRQATGRPPGRASVTHGDLAVTMPPRAPKRRFARPELEAAIAKAVTAGVAQIHGSTGTGKTMLAAAAEPSTVGWIDLRDLPPAAALARLRAAVAHVESRETKTTIVVDDLDPGDDPRSFLPVLQQLSGSLAASGGGLLVTSAHRLPPRLAGAIGLDEPSTFAAPFFNDTEIASYFIAGGCPPGDAENWSKIVHASTSGHPQLVDARLSALQQQNWPMPAITEWVAPTAEMVDVRVEARRMVAALPQDQREMLYRASLVMGRISRKRLIAVGQIAPEIAEPGMTIDRLTGPWLEVTDTSDLRASPLLSGIGVATLGQRWSEDMHAAIAWAWLSDPTLSPGDVATLLMHAALSKQMGPLVRLLPSLLDAAPGVWQEIGDTAGIFSMFGVDDGYDTTFSTAIDRAVFRILQLRIAAAGRTSEAPGIIRRALKEANERADGDVAADFFDFQFLWQVMQLGVVTGDIKAAVDIGVRLRRAAERVKAGIASLDADPVIPDIFSELASVFAMTLLPSLSGMADFRALLDIVEELGLDDRRFILGGSSGEHDAPAMILDTVWVGEDQRSDRDWKALAVELERAFALALQSDLPVFADSAAARLVRTLDQDLNDAAAALTAADKALEELGRQPRLLAAKAKVLCRRGETAASLAIYNEILPTSLMSASYRAEILRDGAAAAAQDKDWPLAAVRFGDAYALLGDEDPVSRRAGYRADHGLALYLAGKTAAALTAFTDATAMIMKDGREVVSEPFRSVRQYIYAGMWWVMGDITRENDSKRAEIEATVGQASATETIIWATGQTANLLYFARQLLDLHLVAPDGDRSVIASLVPLIQQSRNVIIVGTNWETSMRIAIESDDPSRAVREAVRETNYFAALQRMRDRGDDPDVELESDPEPSDLSDAAAFLIVARIVAVIVGLMAKDRLATLPLGAWRADLPEAPGYDRLQTFLESVEDRLVGSRDPIAELFADLPSWEARVLVGLGAVARQRNAGELLAAHAVVASGLHRAPPLKAIVAVPLSRMITKAWVRLCDAPALSVPGISVLAIQEAIASTPVGWKRTHAVLSAALLAVPGGVARQLRDLVDELSG